MSLEPLVGWVGTLLVLSMNLPQIWRTCVRGQVAGVPAARAWVAVSVATMWLGYGLYGGGIIQVALNSGVIVLNLALLSRLVRGEPTDARLRGVLLVVAAVGLTLVLGESGGKVAVGTVGAVIGAGVYLPQLLALRTHGPSGGVSALSLWLQGAGAGCWLAYGLMRSEVEVWTPNVVLLGTTVWTLLLLAEAPQPQTSDHALTRMARVSGRS